MTLIVFMICRMLFAIFNHVINFFFETVICSPNLNDYKKPLESLKKTKDLFIKLFFDFETYPGCEAATHLFLSFRR